jgi:hypothetical protein
MLQVRKVVSAAGRRLWMNDFLQLWCVIGAWMLGALLVTRVVERVFGLGQHFTKIWMWIFIGAAVATTLAALIWSGVRKKKTLAVAQEVDERASLRESLSTALYMEKSATQGGDPWARAMLEDAEVAARRVIVPQVVPIQAPRAWAAPFLALFGVVVAWFAVPSFDIWGKQKKFVQQKQNESQVIAVKAELNETKDKIKEALARTNPQLLDEPPSPEAPEQKALENDPEAIKRAALRELTDLTNRMQEAQLSEKAMQSEALRETMQQLRQPGPGPLDEMSKALSKGEFADAKEALKQLSNQLSEGKLSEEQKEQLKKQMENMAKQLEKLAKDQQQLVKKLQKQGLDKKTAEEMAKKAADPSELKEALEKTPGLNAEQKNDLMKMAQAQQQASEQCSNMSESMSKASQGMSQDGMSQSGQEGMQDMQQEMSQAEMMQSDMENLDAAMQEAKEQMAKLGNDMAKSGKGQGKGGEGEGEGEGDGEGSGKLGQWRAGDSSKEGQGSGGPGKGNGQSPDAVAADYQLDRKKAKVTTGKGPIIGSRLVFGDQVRGESVAEFGEVVAAAEETAAEGIDTMRVPREMEAAVKNYFGSLKQKADGAKSGSQPTAPAKPAEPAKDAPKK